MSIERETDKEKRNFMISQLRNLGNHKHNCEVLRNQKGTLIVTYRPTTNNVSPAEYVPCECCLGYYAKQTLWRHTARCQAAPTTRKHKSSVMAGRLLLPAPKGTSAKLNTVLSSMKSDKISRIVKSDYLILQLGEKLYLKNGHDKEQHSVIRNTLREVGRLLNQLREQHSMPGANLEQFIDPFCFQDVVTAACVASGFCESSHQFRTPSLALKLGHSVKKCARLIRGRCLQNGDEIQQSKAERFLDLVELNWTDEVSTHALRTLYENKRNKVKLIPLTRDVVKLSKYLKSESAVVYGKLHQDQTDLDSWTKLNETILTAIILFNRHRQGEASKMKLEDYLKKHKADGQKAVVDNLSPLEQKLVHSFYRVEIVGKRGRTVPVLLTHDMCLHLDELIVNRLSVGVHRDNKFVFARPHKGSIGHIRGSDCIREFSVKCKAEQPTLIRSTGLKKQIATISQILNLQENELDVLANFLGHDIRVHREFYRLPEKTLQVAKVSKLLIAMERGDIQKGKNLDEIEVDPEEIEAETDEGEEGASEDENDETSAESTREHVHVQQTTPRPAKQKDGKRKKKPRSSQVHDSSAKRPIQKRSWTDAEVAAVKRNFDSLIRIQKLPGKREIEACKAKEASLHGRSWRNIKDFIRHQIKTRKKNAFY